MPEIQCFLLEPTDRVARYLRRYESLDYAAGEKGSCTPKGDTHDAMVRIEDAPVEAEPDGSYRGASSGTDLWPRDDPRWPKACEVCGTPFADSDVWQLFVQRLYRRTDTGAEMTLRDAPAGAMWYAPWLLCFERPGRDGQVLVVKTPGGDWTVDSRASNCTLPNDTEHHCWVRHGTPPTVTVDKNGRTCQAGAGSIQMGSYHGFLRNGELVS